MASRMMATLARETSRAITMLATPATYFKQGTVGRPIKVGWKRVAPTDTEIINAYGLGALRVTIPADAISPDVPAQFDRLELLGELYTIDHVGANYSAEILVSYLCYTMGQKQ